MAHRGPTPEEAQAFTAELAKQGQYGGAVDPLPGIAELALKVLVGSRVPGPGAIRALGGIEAVKGGSEYTDAVVPGPVKALRAKLTGLLNPPKEKLQLIPSSLLEKPITPGSLLADLPERITSVGYKTGIPRARLFIKGMSPHPKYEGLDVRAPLSEAKKLDVDVFRGSPDYNDFLKAKKIDPKLDWMTYSKVGNRTVAETLRFLKAQYPEVEDLGGSRVTGMTAAARDRRIAAGEKDVKYHKASYPLKDITTTEAERIRLLSEPRQWLHRRINTKTPPTAPEKERDMIKKILRQLGGIE